MNTGHFHISNVWHSLWEFNSLLEIISRAEMASSDKKLPLGGHNRRAQWSKLSSSIFLDVTQWYHVVAEVSRDVPRVLMDDWVSTQVCWWFPQLCFCHLWHDTCFKMKCFPPPGPEGEPVQGPPKHYIENPHCTRWRHLQELTLKEKFQLGLRWVEM